MNDLDPLDDSDVIHQLAYSVKQAALAIGLAENTIRQLIREGHLAARFKGAKVLVDAKSLDRYYHSLPSERQVDREVAANRGVR